MSNTIELYALPNLQGDFKPLNADCDDLLMFKFLKHAQSLRVHGDPWIVFTGTKYQGEFTYYKEGTYNSLQDFANKISSVRVVPGGFSKPEITVYEKIDYKEKSVPLEKSADSLKPYLFDDKASSHKTQHGAWILYDGEFYGGNRMFTVAGDEIPNYVSPEIIGVNSVKPITGSEVSGASI
ncbi:hypothetical protein XELAEV_18005584mg [Xenopus laevis]|uniref:Beta/gamma crystallin 'Greek key' domain-containing protein n=1 Tax=Xenopus laevis TaxID=8355 RepID=A0A974DXL3_XENLA|nr:hypothetical protein XELAEV_18005584mg [Xenopus laevis]